MKVYIIQGNNGEMYEDFYEWIESVYIDKEKAYKKLEELKNKAKEDYKKNNFFEERYYYIKEFEVEE